MSPLPDYEIRGGDSVFLLPCPAGVSIAEQKGATKFDVLRRFGGCACHITNARQSECWSVRPALF